MVSHIKYPAFWKEPFLDLAKSIWSMPSEVWIEDTPSLEDIELLKKEAEGISNIDHVNLRAEMISMWKDSNLGIDLRVNELPGRTRVLFLGTPAQWNMVPWAFWSRIFQAIGHPVKTTLFYAHPSLRSFPKQYGQAIQADNINAGYSYLCKQDIVVIYRFEEATRVLLHELLHTACFDSGLQTVYLEASTEAWTELFLCALLSKGSLKQFNLLWKQQCAWIRAQTHTLESNWNVRKPSDYAWRYIKGKQEFLKEKGYFENCILDKNILSMDQVRLRFTSPTWDSFLY